MSNKDTFITMCHTIYDEIHGKEKVKKLFYPIKEVELNILINIYNNEFYKRPRMIQNYIESINTIENKIKLFGDKELDTSLFYINALQHYINKDY
jgi:hypothetical protein